MGGAAAGEGVTDDLMATVGCGAERVTVILPPGRTKLVPPVMKKKLECEKVQRIIPIKLTLCKLSSFKFCSHLTLWLQVGENYSY